MSHLTQDLWKRTNIFNDKVTKTKKKTKRKPEYVM